MEVGKSVLPSSPYQGVQRDLTVAARTESRGSTQLEDVYALANECTAIIENNPDFAPEYLLGDIKLEFNDLYKNQNMASREWEEKMSNYFHFLDTWKRFWRHRIPLIESYKTRGATYISFRSDYDIDQIGRDSPDVYVFNFNFKKRREAWEHWQAFDMLLQFAQHEKCPCLMASGCSIWRKNHITSIFHVGRPGSSKT